MEKTVLSWNIENWLTVVFMVALAYAGSGLVVAFVRGNMPGADADA